MASKHKERSPGCRDRSGPKRSWQMPSRLMAGKNGYVSFDPKPICGPGGVAGEFSLTSPLVCRENTSRLSLRRTKDGIQDHLPRVVGKRESLVIKERSSRSCVHKWTCSVSSKEWSRAFRRRESRREEEVVLKKTARWRLRKKRIASKSCMNRRKAYRSSCGTLRSLRTWSRWSGIAKKKSGSVSCKRFERKRTELLPEHQMMQKRSQKLQSLQD